MIPEVLWAYRTTIKTANEYTPFSLAFGLEAVAPCELVWPSARIIDYNEETNEEKLTENVDLIDNIREQAEVKEAVYKSKIVRMHNKRLRSANLSTGDLVLRNARLTLNEQNKGKLSQNWEGPDIIKEEWKKGTFKLMKENGQEVPRVWHANNLKKFYP